MCLRREKSSPPFLSTRQLLFSAGGCFYCTLMNVFLSVSFNISATSKIKSSASLIHLTYEAIESKELIIFTLLSPKGIVKCLV